MTGLVAEAGAALTASGQTLEQREEKFRDLLREGFDMPFIAKVSLGKQWRKVEPAERETYVALFSEFVLKTYAPRLGKFDPELFHVDDATPKGKRDMLVASRIAQPGGGDVKAGWRIRLVNGQHKIVDIVVEGISMALNQRREFSAVIKKDGVAGLMELLRARTQSLSVQAPS
ncbi:MAG: ABC transporter substrate-binding protein [Pseudomonadota bacterium]